MRLFPAYGLALLLVLGSRLPIPAQPPASNVPVIAAPDPAVQLATDAATVVYVDGRWQLVEAEAVRRSQAVLTLQGKADDLEVVVSRQVVDKATLEVEELIGQAHLVSGPESDQLEYRIEVPAAGRWRVEVINYETRRRTPLYVTIGDAPPVPVPPGPQPPPVPPVAEGKRFILLLYESGDQTPAQAKLWADLRRWDEGEDKHRFVMLDRDVDTPWVDAYRPAESPEQAASYPHLVIQEDGAGGKILYRGKMPATEEAFRQLLKEHGG